MQCPKCDSDMEVVRYGAGDREINRCTGCAGLFFKPIDLKRLKTTYKAEILDHGKASVGRDHDKKHDIDCPSCGTRMDNVSDESQTHIWYESCPKGCGVYFDAGELTDLSQDTLTDIIKGWFKGSRA